MPNPPIIFLNAVHPSVAELYITQHFLVEHFQLPIETINDGLVYFEVRSFAQQIMRDTLCETVEEIEKDLLRVERDYGATLEELAKGSRIIIFIQGFLSQPHIELAMALSLI